MNLKEMKMNTFVNAVKNQNTRTENGMKTRVGSASKCVDLFYKIGASRGKDITADFVGAYVENPELALRIAQWARDARGGAGERKLYRDILQHLETFKLQDAKRLIPKTPLVGRWDDLLVLKGTARDLAFEMIGAALNSGDGLCAKWMPRKGPDALALRSYLKMSPKQYRKTLVTLTNVVETQMCAKNWDGINFEHVPSLAAARYQKAFSRNSPAYVKYKEALTAGEAKINASAVYPYDVIKSMRHGDVVVAQAQWDALPNYMGESSVLALVDVSGSMSSPVSTGSPITAMDVALSLGLYVADKNKGAFKDTFLTFSESPQLLHLKGNLTQKLQQMEGSTWAMNTNLHAAFSKILSTAVNGKVSPEEMPKTLLILSDMQFDSCVRHDDSAIEMIQRKYEAAGYVMPNVVFWNLRDSSGVPVKFDRSGTALVSGFSPAILTSILAGKEFTPEAIMLETIMKDRYAL